MLPSPAASDEVTSFSKILNERSGCQVRLCPSALLYLNSSARVCQHIFKLFILLCVADCRFIQITCGSLIIPHPHRSATLFLHFFAYIEFILLICANHPIPEIPAFSYSFSSASTIIGRMDFLYPVRGCHPLQWTHDKSRTSKTHPLDAKRTAGRSSFGTARPAG